MMARLRAWLRPPRNLLLLFLLVIAWPAATLVILGVRLLEQDRALAGQRQAEVLDRGGDLDVRALEIELTHLKERLAVGLWSAVETAEDSLYVAFRGERSDVLPPGRLLYASHSAASERTAGSGLHRNGGAGVSTTGSGEGAGDRPQDRAVPGRPASRRRPAAPGTAAAQDEDVWMTRSTPTGSRAGFDPLRSPASRPPSWRAEPGARCWKSYRAGRNCGVRRKAL